MGDNFVFFLIFDTCRGVHFSVATVLYLLSICIYKIYKDFSLRFETWEYLEKNYDSELRVRKTDTGHRTQDTGHRTQDTGDRTQDTGHRTQDTGP